MIVVRISRYDKWSADYIIPTNNIIKAKEIAFNHAKQEFSCYLPSTYKEMEDEIKILSDNANYIM